MLLLNSIVFRYFSVKKRASTFCWRLYDVQYIRIPWGKEFIKSSTPLSLFAPHTKFQREEEKDKSKFILYILLWHILYICIPNHSSSAQHTYSCFSESKKPGSHKDYVHRIHNLLHWFQPTKLNNSNPIMSNLMSSRYTGGSTVYWLQDFFLSFLDFLCWTWSVRTV